MWTRGVGGERLPFAQTCKNLNFCRQRGILIFCRLFSIHERRNVFLKRPTHITGRRVNTVSLGWVGATNERAPFRVHDAVIGFDDQYLTRFQIADQGVGVS